MIRIDAGTFQDHVQILALNDAAVPAVNRIDATELAGLHAQAAHLLIARHQSTVAGFLLALGPRAEYSSPNYRYFRRHYDQFVYVDRIVVHEQHRGRGVGAQLYAELFERADSRVTCEVNLKPPNLSSLRFHERLMFRIIGEQDTEGGAKRVALMVRECPA